MDYSTCYNCGQQGHFASSCPLDPKPPPDSGNHPKRWKAPRRLPPDEQAAINARGVALCREALSRHT